MKPLAVCHVMTADLWAGAEVQLATTAAYLARRPDVNVSAVLMNEGKLADELRRLGLRVAVFDEARHSSLSLVGLITGFLRDHCIDVVHTHRYKDTVVGTVAAALAGVPHVVRTVHGPREPMRGWSAAKFAGYEWLERMMLRANADLVIGVSDDLIRRLHDRAYPPAMLARIYNGIDLAKVRPSRPREVVRRELGFDTNAIVIGTVGRLSAVKDQANLLRAARLILDQQPKARVLIVGGGPMQRELGELASTLELGSACRFVGERTDVHDLTAAMDMFVLPSLSEGIPMALLEAMALGKPVVVSAVGGLPEIVSHGQTGLLVPPHDSRALANACLELVRDRAHAWRMGERARQVVAERFSEEQSGRQLFETYRTVVRRRPSRLTTATAMSLGQAAAGARSAWRRVWQRIERRRCERIRREPEALATALKSARQVLVLCHGNIMRSPFAATLLREALRPQNHPVVLSAGLEARAGHPAADQAIACADRYAIDLRQHRASPLSPALIAASDVILVMDVGQLRTMRRRFPEARGRTFLLTSLAPDGALDIRDPLGADDDTFRRCYEQIVHAVQPMIPLLRQEPLVEARA